MARIRSIKPDFWRDAKIAALPKSTALFFIALWNFADDQGIVETDSRSLSLQVPIYRSQDIQKMLYALWQAALIQCSPVDGLAFISGWKHQKIDKPRDGKYKDKQIKWLTWSDYSNSRDQSSTVRRKDRIGKDKIGGDRIRQQNGKAAQAAEPAALAPEKPEPSKSHFLIARYCDAWKLKHGSSPDITGKDAGIAARLAKSLSIHRITILLEAYFAMPDAWLMKVKHPLEAFEARLKEIAAFADSGAFITRRQATQFDDMASNAMLLERIRQGGV